MNRISEKFITTIIHIILIFFLPSLSFASDFPKQKSFIVMDGSCCGGEESDPHAVHGIQTESGAFVLSGKIIDGSGYEDGFVVKVPHSLPVGQIFLHDEEEFNLDWMVKIGKTNKRDGINAAASMNGAVFAGGYMQDPIRVFVSKIRKTYQLLCCHTTSGQFCPYHLNVILALAVNSLLQAKQLGGAANSNF